MNLAEGKTQSNKLQAVNLRRELKTALPEGRTKPGVPIWLKSQSSWAVVVERVYNTPRGGPMAAWKFLYYLVSPEHGRWGGYDRADSFVDWAMKWQGPPPKIHTCYDAAVCAEVHPQ